MKFLKVLFSTIIILAAIGFGVYYFGTKLIADQVMEKVSVELNDSGRFENIKQEIAKDAELSAFIEEGKDIDSSKLPFQTKEEATRVLVKKFKISDIQEFQSKAKNGLTEEEKQELLDKLEGNLTDEEILALKVLAYKEFSK